MPTPSRRTFLAGSTAAGLSMAVSGRWAAPAHTAAPPGAIERVTVFHRGQDGYHSFRPPNLLQANDGTLLAITGGLVGAGGDFGHHDTVLKRSFDGGRTWGPLQVIASDPPNNLARSAVVDRLTGRIHVMVVRTAGYVTGSDLSNGLIPQEDRPRPFHMYSDDHGETWSDWRDRDLTDVLKVPEMRHYVIGPGPGIQIMSGPHSGRLVFVGNHNFLPVSPENPGSVRGIHVAYSDDHGETWQLGGVIGGYTRPDFIVDETSLAEREDGTLYLNSRDQHGPAAGNRGATTSSDGGATFDAPYELVPELVTPIVHCGMTTIPAARGRAHRIVFTGPQHPTSREQLTVRSSVDGGATWRQGPVIHDGPAGYSSPLLFADPKRGEMFGVLYENGPRVSPDNDLTYRYALDFARVPLSLLERLGPVPTTTPDVSGHGRHGVVGGEPARVAGTFGRGLELRGHYIEVPLADELRAGDGPFTVAAWYRTAHQGAQRVVSAYDFGTRPQFRVEVHPGSVRGILVTDNGNATARAEVATADNTWHHVALTRDAHGLVRLYLDGDLAASATGALGTVGLPHAHGPIRFGARIDTIDNALFGTLDELFFGRRALSDAEVGMLYASNVAPPGSALVRLPLDRIRRH